jgi:hypothetical protein
MRTTSRFWYLVPLVCVSLGAATIAAQSRATDRVMRQKLAVSQKILEAVVTSRWADLEAGSRELADLTGDPGWAVLKKPEYAQHSKAFRESVEALHEAAARRDLEAAPKAYVAMTLGCVDCHRYLARNRFAHK